MDDKVNAVARRLKRIGVRSDITSDEEVTKKRKKPPAASSPNAAKSTIEKGSSESLLPEDSNVMNGFDPESDSLASYVEVVYSAYETAQDTVDEREKESFKELVLRSTEEHRQALQKYPFYDIPANEKQAFRIYSDSEDDEYGKENLTDNPRREKAVFRYWANKSWKGKIADCPVYTLPTTDALPPSKDFGLTHINVLRDDRSVLPYIPYFTDQKTNSKNEKKLMQLMQKLYCVGVNEITNVRYMNNRYLLEILRILIQREQKESEKNDQGPGTSAEKNAKKISNDSEFFSLTAEKLENLPLEYFEAFSRLKPVWGNAEKIKKRILKIFYELEEKNFDQNSKFPKMEKMEDFWNLATKIKNSICRRCFQFGCLRHQSHKENEKIRGKSNGEEIDFVEKAPKKSNSLVNKPNEPCGPECFYTQNSKNSKRGRPKSQKSDANQNSKSESKVEKSDFEISTSIADPGAEWSAAEIFIFNLEQPTFGRNYCVIAIAIGSKTCEQVGRYAAAMAAKDGEDIETWMSPKASPTSASISGGTSGKGKRRSSTNRETGKERRLRRNRMSAYKIANDSEAKGKHAGHLQPYVPCNHPAVDCLSADPDVCCCKRAGTLCEKYCSCAHFPQITCSIRFTYCKCSVGKCSTKLCPCFSAKRECDPDHCTSCGAVPETIATSFGDEPAQTICKNVALQRRLWKKVKKDVSLIPGAGYGCFADEVIKIGELVEEYTGEIISDAEADRRGLLADRRHYSYIFNLNARFSIDALKLGSMIRFANDQPGRKANCQPRIMLVNGDHRIGIYAARDIAVGEELTFDYSYEKEMQWNHFDGDLRSQSSNSRKRTVSKISRRRQSESTESDESAKQGSQQSGSVSLDEISAVSRSSKSRKSKIASTSKTQ